MHLGDVTSEVYTRLMLWTGPVPEALDSILRGPVLPFLSNLQNQLHFLVLNMSIQLGALYKPIAVP
jgi:hypothetical protein